MLGIDSPPVAITSDSHVHLAERRVEQEAAFAFSMVWIEVSRCRLDADLIALVEQHVEDVAGLVVAEQLAEFFLVVGMPCLPTMPMKSHWV